MSALERLGIVPDEVKQDGYSGSQGQTEEAFSFKWAKRDTYESETVSQSGKRWLIERYCAGDESRLDEWLSRKGQIILDAGCGAAYSALLFFGDRLKDHDYLGVDISDACWVAKQRFDEAGYPGDFMKCSLLDIPAPEGSVDMILSEGVLHHTDNTEVSLKLLAKKLKPGGRFLFYVYAKKGVIREFTDDYIREHLKSLPDEKAWEALESLTKLGIALGELNVKLDVPEDIPYLGIKKGELDIQRFFYWNVCKLFYKPDYSLDEMNCINFDWFRPINCHRHTPEEVRRWCVEAGLDIEHMDVQESGITVVAIKQ